MDIEVTITHLKDAPAIKDVCGIIHPYPNIKDLNIGRAKAVIQQPTIPHFHKKMIEIYFVLKGHGLLIITNKKGTRLILIGPHSEIIIPPMHAHYTIPYEKMEVYVPSIPEWSQDDLYELETDCPEVGHVLKKEKESLLIHVLNQANKEIDAQNKTFAERMSALENEARKINKLPIPQLRKLLRVE